MSSKLEQDYLYIGQTYTRVVPLRVDGKPVDITSATVTARFTRVSGTYATNNGAAVSCADTGNSDYSCGVVEVVFTDVETTALAAGHWTLELKVVEAGGDVLIFQCSPSVLIQPTGHTTT